MKIINTALPSVPLQTLDSGDTFACKDGSTWLKVAAGPKEGFIYAVQLRSGSFQTFSEDLIVTRVNGVFCTESSPAR